MQMNDYIQKYGEKALQIYQKSLRNSQTLNQSSPMKQSQHLLPKKSNSKKLLKSNSYIKHNSQMKLNHSKSARNTKYVESIDIKDSKKKVSFIQSKKTNHSTISSNGFYHTFNKINNANKKKLIISDVTTPKCSTPIRLKHELKIQKQNQKETERNSKSNKKSAKKRKHIEQKLQQTLNDKKTIKNLVKGVTQCLEIIFSQDQKMRKMFYLLKETIDKISNLAQKYKTKLKKAEMRIQQLNQIQHVYIEKGKVKAKLSQKNLNGEDINKKNGIQVIILNENYQLRKKITKLEKEIEYYTNKQASLMNVFGKYKNTNSQIKKSKIQDHLSEDKNYSKFQINDKVINFYSNDPNRRSSQNLSSKVNVYKDQRFQQKRLSFDGYEGNIKKQKDKLKVQLNQNVQQLSEQQSSQNQ